MMGNYEIQYRFAFDQNDNLVDVANLNRADITESDRFFSVDFHQELIPRLGLINQKHFAHKSVDGILGSKETYLHALAKRVFFDMYSVCLNNGIPIYIPYLVTKKCNRIQNEYGVICHLGDDNMQFDLTTYFTEIFMEKRDDCFIPDLLLFNPNTLNKIYIEIAVTHKCSNEKINSGYRIIEFTISKEDDILYFFPKIEVSQTEEVRFPIATENKKVRYYNFKKRTETKEFCTVGNCKCYKFAIFTVLENGKCRLDYEHEDQLLATINKKTGILYQKIKPLRISPHTDNYYFPNYLFKKYVLEAFAEGIPIKDCFTCRFAGTNRDDKFICILGEHYDDTHNASVCPFYKLDIRIKQPIKSVQITKPVEITYQSQERIDRLLIEQNASWTYMDNR
jgi:hypothetical protein